MKENIILKPYSKAKVLGDNPTLIGTVDGIDFYEHPRLGDESPLIAIIGETCGLCSFYELPNLHELRDAYSINNP